jgi:hypothetical protein
MRRYFALLAGVFLGCGAPSNQPPGKFGEVTSAVVLVNPVINAGSSTTVSSGNTRANVSIQAGYLLPVQTDMTGLAVIYELPTGTVPLELDTGSVNLTIQAEKELYDVVLSYDSAGVQHVIPPVRYPLGGVLKIVEPGESIAAAATDDSILMLKEGTYPGGFEITAQNVLIFGDWTVEDGQRSVINGTVTVKGTGVRMRGVDVTGTLTSNANSFSAAFCKLGGANITGNQVSLLRNEFVSAGATVPSSNAVLVDNEGIP